jgi:hypothetical protein
LNFPNLEILVGKNMKKIVQIEGKIYYLKIAKILRSQI